MGPPGLPCAQLQHQLLLAFTVGSTFPPARPLVQVWGCHPGWAHGRRKVNTQAGSDCHGHGTSTRPGESEGQECFPGSPFGRGQHLWLQVLGERRSPRTPPCSDTLTGHKIGELEPSRRLSPPGAPHWQVSKWFECFVLFFFLVMKWDGKRAAARAA